jgi:hypothetical protein
MPCSVAMALGTALCNPTLLDLPVADRKLLSTKNSLAITSLVGWAPRDMECDTMRSTQCTKMPMAMCITKPAAPISSIREQ